MQTSYTKAVEAAAEAIKAVEDVNARAEVVKEAIEIAHAFIRDAIGTEKQAADEMIAVIQRQDHARRRWMGEIGQKLSDLKVAIEGRDTEPAPTPVEIEPLKEAAE